MPASLATGRIVWAQIADANGTRKLRPAVIVTPADRLLSGQAIDVVAVTTVSSSPTASRFARGQR